MKTKNEIEKLARNIKVKSNHSLDNRILHLAEDALDKATGKQQTNPRPEPSKWRIAIRHRITKLTAAAVVIIALTVGITMSSESLAISIALSHHN